MHESNRRSRTPTKWCRSRLTRMNINGYNNTATKYEIQREKKNSSGEAEAYGFKRKRMPACWICDLGLDKSTFVLPGSSTPKLRMKAHIPCISIGDYDTIRESQPASLASSDVTVTTANTS